jgi:mannose PTS system EIIA component
MIGMVVVTHGHLASALISAMEHVVGVQKGVKPICIEPEDDMQTRRDEIAAAVLEVDQGQGVIIFTDMFGGTPSNLSLSIMEGRFVEVIAGVNVPMLIRLARLRGTMPLEEAVRQVQEAGRKYITIASDVLAYEKEGKK